MKEMSLKEYVQTIKINQHVFDNCIHIKDEDHDYEELDGIRLVVEDGKIIGWYKPEGEEEKEQELYKEYYIGTLEDTVPYMLSENYKDRLIAEYYQLALRRESLQAYLATAEMTRTVWGSPERAKLDLMYEQMAQMSAYARTLEERARQTGVELFSHRLPVEHDDP